MDVPALSSAQATFVMNLYKAVAANHPDKNAVLSPVSISLALAMVVAGAKGLTLEQIATCINLPPGDVMQKFSAHLKIILSTEASKHGLELSCANRLWVDATVPLRPRFTKLLKQSYGAEAASVDFIHNSEDARERVNKWGEDETHGKIADVLPVGSVTTDTRLILANAIYFKGMWKKPFAEAMTQIGDFFLPDGSTIQVPMMHSRKTQCFKAFPTFKAVRLPYHLDDATRAFSMIVLLPNDKNGLAEMEATLNTQTILNEPLGYEVAMSKMQLPKWKVSFGTEMVEILRGLGVELIFGEEADLSGMTDAKSKALYVSSVRHKAFVEVNEKGTEAAAVTAAVFAVRCSATAHVELNEFVADHPFMFLIKEETSNTIIFTGRVIDPSKET